jgi:hypothetical protein
VGLELLTQADMVLNACGRPVPPPGYKFVDLPRIIPFHHTPQGVLFTPHFTFTDEVQDSFTITGIFPGFPPQSGVSPGGFQPVLLTFTANNGAGNTGVVVHNADGTITITLNYDSTAGLDNEAAQALFSSIPALTPYLQFTFLNAPVGGGGFPGWAADPTLYPFASGFTFTEGWPTQEYVENTSNTLFICMGIMLQTDPISVRIKWPNGRYWNQFPSGNPYAAQSSDFPQGTGGNLYAFDEFVHIERGGKVAIEMSGTNTGNVDVHLWGKLRYLLKDKGGVGELDGQTCIIGYPDAAKPQGPPNCLVGYPVKAGATLSGAAIKMIPDPIEVLKARPRFSCWPNGNIFAPEFRLGNQCETDTPPGYDDESYTFFSDPIILNAANSGQSYSNAVDVPGQNDVVIRRWRAICTWTGDQPPTGIPVVQIRLPNGYSVTGGDQIPIDLGYWYPVFPTLRVIAGTRLILDVTDPLGGEPGTLTVTFEFDAVKRRKRIQ